MRILVLIMLSALQIQDAMACIAWSAGGCPGSSDMCCPSGMVITGQTYRCDMAYTGPQCLTGSTCGCQNAPSTTSSSSGSTGSSTAGYSCSDGGSSTTSSSTTSSSTGCSPCGYPGAWMGNCIADGCGPGNTLQDFCDMSGCLVPTCTGGACY